MNKLVTSLILRMIFVALKSYTKNTKSKKDDAIYSILVQLESMYSKFKSGSVEFDSEIDGIEKAVDLLISEEIKESESDDG